MKKESKKFWDLLNSNFFLWAIGAIVLSFVPFIWSEWKTSIDKEDRVEKIDTEIKNRFSQMIALFLRQKDSVIIEGMHINFKDSSGKNLNNDTNKIETKKIFFYFKNSPKESHNYYYSSYKEFEDYSSISLLNELEGLESDTLNKHEIRLIANRILLNQIDSTTSFPIKENSNCNNLIYVSKIKRSLLLSRWL